MLVNDQLCWCANGTYFRWSPFQAYSNDTNATHIGDPTANNGSTGVIDDTARYIDVTDGKYWANTHYTGLEDITVGTSYNYGDNIFYKGEHYVYVDHLSSDNPRYLAGADSGLSSMEKLIDYGAVMKLDMYIDTVGGGGNASMADGVLPNQTRNSNLSTGYPTVASVPLVRKAYRFSSSLQAMVSLILSTISSLAVLKLEMMESTVLDDFYTATVDPNVALNGQVHVDADADNNKELLDTSNTLADFSVADFVDFIQTLANVRAVNGGTMSRLSYAERILEENEINLGAAHSRIMDTDMAYESTKMARRMCCSRQPPRW